MMIFKVIVLFSALLFLAACGGGADEGPATSQDNLDYTESDISAEIAVTIIETDADQDDSQNESTADIETETAADVAAPLACCAVPDMFVSEHVFQAAKAFLSQMTTIFTGGDARVETYWDGVEETLTGRYIIGWDSDWQAITTYETPEIFRSLIAPWQWGFFDAQGNRIEDAPWLFAYRGDDWVSYNYAGHFKLFDVDGNGIPEIFVHFNQTFDGGYAGLYHIFRYVDGEYRLLEKQSFVDGVGPQRAWLGIMHEFFVDSYGRFITFVNSDYHGLYAYEHLVITNERAEFHMLASLDDWDSWQEHHWTEWVQTGSGWEMVDSWRHNDLYIYRTEIPLTPIYPMDDLRDELMAVVMDEFF